MIYEIACIRYRDFCACRRISSLCRMYPAGNSTAKCNTNPDINTYNYTDRRSHHLHERFGVCTGPVLPPDKLYQYSLQAALHRAMYQCMRRTNRLWLRVLRLCRREMPNNSQVEICSNRTINSHHRSQGCSEDHRYWYDRTSSVEHKRGECSFGIAKSNYH